MKERRAFNLYPRTIRTDLNNRETYLIDDPLFEPEQFEYRNGYIGDVGILTADDLARTPRMASDLGVAREIEQYQVGAVYVDPETRVKSKGAFVSDLVNQIAMNGGLVEDQNRLFSQHMYNWSPPIDYDKIINYSRYYWVAPGDATVNGEYVTKEASGSMTVLHKFDGSAFIRVEATMVNALPGAGALNDLVELSSNVSRSIYRWNGSAWVAVIARVVEDVPTNLSNYSVNDYVYVARTGPLFNRPLLWMYSSGAGRWISQSVVVSPVEPIAPHEGTVWEDPSVRKFRRYFNGAWTDLVYTTGIPTGIVADGTVRYDIRKWSDVALDTWSQNNWWMNQKDLSPVDQAALRVGDQAIRPIIEFWNGIEATGPVRTTRNQSPLFKMYQYSTSAITDPSLSTPIFTYKRGTGRDDLVLGFPLSFDENGEFQFELNLELGTGPLGYRLFKNSQTSNYHSIWSRSADPVFLSSRLDDNNQIHYEIPPAMVSNPDHQILTTATRPNVINHMISVIGTQSDGDNLGINSWRWSSKNLSRGAHLRDPEHSMLLPLALVQDPNLDIPDAIRFVEKEYARFWTRFTRRMTEIWDRASLTDGQGQLISLTPTQIINVILTDMFASRNSSFPYYYSGMGTYQETRVSAGVATIIDTALKPICVPASPARTGCGPTYVPGTFTENGTVYLRGHEGTIIESFGDHRDLVWLALHQKMYTAVDVTFKTESSLVTTRHGGKTFVQDFYGDYYPTETRSVYEYVADYTLIVTPVTGNWYASLAGLVYAKYNGATWSTSPIPPDDVFYDDINAKYYFFNGLTIYEIKTFNHPVNTYRYSMTEFRRIIRREFERWVINHNMDYVVNSTYNNSDPFTWNFSSSGLEGNYKGIYRRLYKTPRPHSHPWEVVGYSIEPTWWRTTYVPTSTSGDGTPRYGSAHTMWVDLQNGLVHSPLNIFDPKFEMLGPIPVDVAGALRDPIALGIVLEGALDPRRLNDGWVFGDGGPVEEKFYNSSHYAYACSLAGYLMRPLEWIATKWGDQTFYLNGLFTSPHLIDRTSLRRSPIADNEVHLLNGPVIGLNMWITDRISSLGVSVAEGFAKIVQNTQPSMAWKTYGYINPERTVYTLLGGSEIPYEDASVIPYKSRPTSSEFGSGLYLIREDSGYRVFGYDYNNPFFRIETPSIPVQGGQVERKETFTADINQRTYVLQNLVLPTVGKANDTAKLAFLINGMKIRSEYVVAVDQRTIELDPVVQINGGETITVVVLTAISNASTMMKKFTVRGVDYFYFSEGSGTYIDVPYGTFLPGASEVVNFMIGYGRYLDTRGWKFETYHDDDSDIRDFLTGAKQFAVWLSEITNPQLMRVTQQADFDSFYFTPFFTVARFDSTLGQLDTVESIQNGLYGVINKRGEPIPPPKLDVLKIGNGIKITSTDFPVLEGENEIYGVRVNISEAQHVVFFSQRTRFGQLIYDPVLGIYQPTIRVDTYRTKEWSGQFDAPGHLIGEEKLLTNFEKQATDFTRFYDRIDPIDDPLKRDQAWNLYGYYPMDSYMDQLGADERSRFDYYRGMIHAKGTIRAINAFAKGTRAGLDNIQVYEDWLWKLTEFGDQNRDEVQFRVFHTDFFDKIQTVRFGSAVAGSRALVIPDLNRVTPGDTRWIIPTRTTNSLVSTFRFPTVNGDIDYRNSYTLKLSDTDDNTLVLDHTLFDPIEGKYDRKSESLIDYRSFYDPALYNVGPKAPSSNNLTWGPDKVGRSWWRLGLARYSDYKSLLPFYEQAASEWGRMEYCNATITQQGDTVTINLLDPVTGAPFVHQRPLNNATLITITGADQPAYNMHQVYAIATTTTQLQLKIKSTVGTATGNIVVQLGHIEVMEWIESPVPPDQWMSYVSKLPDSEKVHGKPFFVNNPTSSASYSVYEGIDKNNRVTRKYYFWVVSYTGTENKKEFTCAQIARRLENPTREGVPWFAPVNSTSMFIYSGGEKIKDTYSYAVGVDSRLRNSHDEWILITENDKFKNPPIQVEDKIIDCFSRIDKLGNPVPDPYLVGDEIHGSALYPPQTIFKNVETGFTVWLTAVNKILARKSFRDDPNATRYFQLVDEFPGNALGYWTRTPYRMKEFEKKTILETVPTIAERNYRMNDGFYFEGDVVRVLTTTNSDLWNLAGNVYADYALVSGAWTEVGVENQTLRLLPTLYNNPTLLRRVYEDVKILLNEGERNDLLFSVLYEMIRQNEQCSWFLKTSYLDLHVSDKFRQDRFVRPNEVDALVNNINDVKPFHSKLRDKEIILTVANQENDTADSIITDDAVSKTVLVFDRLSSNMQDEYGWDTPYFDEDNGFSKNLWNITDLGRDEWFQIGTQNGNGVATAFVFSTDYTPSLYEQRFKFITISDSSEVDISELGLTYTWILGPRTITLEFSGAISALLRVEIYQTVGFVEGPAVVGSPYAGSYYHQAARMIVNHNAIPFGDRADDLGQAPERIVAENLDSASVLVRNDTSLGERDFAITIGQVPVLPVGIEILETSTDTVMSGQTFLRGNFGHIISSVTDNGATLVLNTNYTITAGTIVTFLIPIIAGHTVKIIYSGFPVGKLGTYQITDTPGPFTINKGYLYLTTPVVTDTISVNYLYTRNGVSPTSLAAMPDYVVDDVLTNHLQFDSPLGLEVNRRVGLKILNTTTNVIWTWNGTIWVSTVTLAGTKKILALRSGKLWTFAAGVSTLTYSVGDAIPGSPIFVYPVDGEGIGFGTEFFGTDVNAAIDWPAAYAVMQSATIY